MAVNAQKVLGSVMARLDSMCLSKTTPVLIRLSLMCVSHFLYPAVPQIPGILLLKLPVSLGFLQSLQIIPPWQDLTVPGPPIEVSSHHLGCSFPPGSI